MGKILLILGASSDLGVAFIRTEIERYSYIIAHYNHSVGELLQLQKDYPEKISLKRADFSIEDEVKGLIEEIIQEERIPGYVIHFPAVKCKLRRFHKIPYEEFQTNMQISVYSIVLILQRLLPLMAKRHYGKIVFVLSIHTITGSHKYIADYLMAKFALLSLMGSLTAEYREKGIRVNSVSPDTIETKFISELPRLAVDNKRDGNIKKKLLKASDVVSEIAYLLDESSDCLYGQNIGVIG